MESITSQAFRYVHNHHALVRDLQHLIGKDFYQVFPFCYREVGVDTGGDPILEGYWGMTQSFYGPDDDGDLDQHDMTPPQYRYTQTIDNLRRAVTIAAIEQPAVFGKLDFDLLDNFRIQCENVRAIQNHSQSGLGDVHSRILRHVQLFKDTIEYLTLKEWRELNQKAANGEKVVCPGWLQEINSKRTAKRQAELIPERGKSTAARTGRPIKNKLTKQQLKSIHRRTREEHLSVIFQSYPDFKYHTAYRQYKHWLKENH